MGIFSFFSRFFQSKEERLILKENNYAKCQSVVNSLKDYIKKLEEKILNAFENAKKELDAGRKKEARRHLRVFSRYEKELKDSIEKLRRYESLLAYLQPPVPPPSPLPSIEIIKIKNVENYGLSIDNERLNAQTESDLLDNIDNIETLFSIFKNNLPKENGEDAKGDNAQTESTAINQNESGTNASSNVSEIEARLNSLLKERQSNSEESPENE